MNEEEEFEIIVGKKTNRSKDQVTKTMMDQLSPEEQGFEKSWDVVNLYLRMKDLCKEKGVDLLDRCGADDLFDFAFGILTQDSVNDNSE